MCPLFIYGQKDILFDQTQFLIGTIFSLYLIASGCDEWSDKHIIIPKGVANRAKFQSVYVTGFDGYTDEYIIQPKIVTNGDKYYSFYACVQY